MENETNVSPAPASQEPAKTAATEPPIAPAGGAPGEAAVSSSETPVSSVPFHLHDIVSIDGLKEAVQAAVHELGVQLGEDTLAGVRKLVEDAIESAKADIIKHVGELVMPIVAKSAEDAAAAASSVPAQTAHVLAVNDRVKVWADQQHKFFSVGMVVAIHDGAHAFDVRLDYGSVTKVGADGLEFDDRA